MRSVEKPSKALLLLALAGAVSACATHRMPGYAPYIEILDRGTERLPAEGEVLVHENCSSPTVSDYMSNGFAAFRLGAVLASAGEAHRGLVGFRNYEIRTEVEDFWGSEVCTVIEGEPVFGTEKE